ncbi:MAG: hypothetical protein KI786_06460, partial [Mameliella sp.]|nr:hypothetical protein [Phaeodactylibacter sp.]
VSHWVMLPFILGLALLLFPIGRFFSAEWGWMFPVLTLAMPPITGQLVMVSPDVILCFGFMLSLFGILHQKSWAKVIGALFLAAISTRGMMTVVILYLFDTALPLRATSRSFQANKKKAFNSLSLVALLVKRALPYIPSGLLALAFLGYHYAEKGWIGYHASSEWAPSFAQVGITGLLKNGIVLGWRLADYGMVFCWISLGIVLWKAPGILKNQKVRSAATLTGIGLLLLAPTFLLYSGLQQHRYLLPLLISLLLLTFTAIAQSPLSKSWKSGLFALLFLGLTSGNLWVYPDTIAQSWDTTLAHVPYFSVKKEMIQYLDKENIPLEDVGTAFPEIGPQHFKDLSKRTDGFSEKDLDNQQFVLYSNVMNDFSDGELELLQEEWILQKALRSGGIKVQLYRKP